MTEGQFKKIFKIKMVLADHDLEVDLYKIAAVVLYRVNYDAVTMAQRHDAKTAMYEFIAS